METFYSYSPVDSESHHNVLQALKPISQDPSIVVTKPDKGNGVVILNKSDYHAKMDGILSDCTKFSPVNQEWFKTIIKSEDKVNRFLSSSLQSGNIDKSTYDNLRISSSRPGVLFGLPKVHKQGVPLRPILSSIGTSGYSIAKFLVPYLDPLTTNEFTVKDSFHFAREISQLSGSDNLVMASFDIKSLFTNIPLEETIDIVANYLYSNNMSFLSFSIDQFKKFLRLAVKDTLFQFNDKLYRQIDGVAMGSPLGPTLANIFLSFHEKQWLHNCPVDFRPSLYRRYIDDTFLLFNDVSHVTKFLDYINSQHPSIQFTCDKESNGKLNFLDISVSRENNQFVTSVYRKPTFTGLGMNFHSFVPNYFKTNLIASLMHRAFKICSQQTCFERELEFLKSFFLKNNFPFKFVNNVFAKTLHKIYNSKPPLITVEKKPIYVSLPYLGKDSFVLKKKLQSLARRFYPHIDLKLILKNNFTVGSLFKFKDRLPFSLRSSVIYQYSCGQCSSSYIGQTVKQLKVRISQHKGRSFRTNNLLACPENSKILEHSISTGHPVVDNNFKIIDYCHNFDLRILESLWIQKLKPSLNDRSSSAELFIVS